MSWRLNWVNDRTDIEGQGARQLLCCWGSTPPPHHHFRVKRSGSWHSSSAQALWFYLSLSFRPAFHTYSWVSSSCLCSEMMPVESSELFHPGHTWSQQIFHRMQGAPVQISASVPAKAPRRHTEVLGVLKPLWFHVFKAKTMCPMSDFHKCLKCLSQGDFKPFQDLESPHSLCLRMRPENLL